MKINCTVHGEVEFEGIPDFIGDSPEDALAQTVYCPECEIERETDALPSLISTPHSGDTHWVRICVEFSGLHRILDEDEEAKNGEPCD